MRFLLLLRRRVRTKLPGSRIARSCLDPLLWVREKGRNRGADHSLQQPGPAFSLPGVSGLYFVLAFSKGLHSLHPPTLACSLGLPKVPVEANTSEIGFSRGLKGKKNYWKPGVSSFQKGDF